MRDLNTAIVGIDAAATSHLGHAERGPRQLKAVEQGREYGPGLSFTRRS